MKKILIPLLAIGLLVGCEGEKPVAHLEGVKVVNKYEETHGRGIIQRVTIQKNGNKATFRVNGDIYDSIEKGSVIDADQYKNGRISNITFPNLK